MVPFVALLLFLFAEYYVFHGIFLFFNILFYLKLKENRQMTRKTFLEWLVLFVAAVLLNCGGQRCLSAQSLLNASSDFLKELKTESADGKQVLENSQKTFTDMKTTISSATESVGKALKAAR